VPGKNVDGVRGTRRAFQISSRPVQRSAPVLARSRAPAAFGPAHSRVAV
jgi:hypothetical protein